MSYIGNKPGTYSRVETLEQRLKVVATSNGQTSFTTNGYEPANLKVYLNGILLDTTDYIAINGTTIVLNSGAVIDDELTYVSEAVFTPSVDFYGVAIDGATIGGVAPAAATVTSLTDSGNLTFTGTGTGNRITGDFSNTTVANRVMFQTSTPNATTAVPIAPSASGYGAWLQLFENSDTANGAFGYLYQSTSQFRIATDKLGTGSSYLPMTFYTGGVERARLDISGGFSVKGALQTYAADAVCLSMESTTATITACRSGGNYSQLVFKTAGADSSAIPVERMRIDTAGNVSIGTALPVGKFVVHGPSPEMNLMDSGANGTRLWMKATNTDVQIGTNYSSSNVPIKFVAGGGASTMMTIDASGNVGIGGTPSAWIAGYKAIEFASSGNAITHTDSNSNLNLFNNRYVGSGGNTYVATGYSTQISQNRAAGSVQIITYPSGSAGAALGTIQNAFSITQTDCVMTTANGGLGYGTGAGGTYAQATSKATTVTATTPSGKITMFTTTTINAGATATFSLNNSLIGVADGILVTLTRGAGVTAFAYQAWVDYVAAGSCVIVVKNISAGNLAEAVTMNFQIIKGATS